MRWSRPGRVALLLCPLLIAACRAGGGPVHPSVNSIVVGYSYTGSGPLAGECRGVRDGYSLWAATLNKAGGIALGARRVPVELVGYDDGGSALQAAENAERLLTRDGAALLLGPCTAATTQAMAIVAQQFGRLLVVTAPYVDGVLPAGATNVIDVGGATTAAANAAATHLASLSGKPRVALLWADDQPAVAIGTALASVVPSKGIDIAAIGAFPATASDLSGPAARIAAAGAAAIAFVGHPLQAELLLTALTSTGAHAGAFLLIPVDQFGSVGVALAAAGGNSTLLLPYEQSGTAPNDALFASEARFASAFAAATGAPPDPRGRLAFAGGEVAGAALSGAHSVESADLRAWLARGGHIATVAGTLPISAQAGDASVAAAGAIPPGQPPANSTPNATPARRATP